ncbi:MAG: protein tyrosine phosphatase [Aquamicrobium sp.]|nr:protein tyrosine phosphatase [Aquamicrobium sp.]
MVIHVCPLTRVEETVAASGAARLVTLLAAGTPFERPVAIDPANHLSLWMNDIVEAQAGLVAPGRVHVESLIRFAQDWDRAQPLVINCYAGISRSTAAAFIVAAALRPERDEAELAWTLRLVSPSATPNPGLVRHADALLGREGRMVAAVAAIGRGADAFEGAPFALPLGG